MCFNSFHKSSHLEVQGFHSTPLICCIMSHVVYLESNMPSCCVSAGLDVNFQFSAISSAELFRRMVKLTMHWIRFPFWPSSGFSFSFFSAGGLIVISQQSISNDPPPVYVMFFWGIASGDIYERRHGTSCTAPTCFHSVGIQSLSLGKCLALKLISLYADRIL